jgi:flavin reductase (DIM6/NTAB) family NADH-FMN oxidoreductase RutF
MKTIDPSKQSQKDNYKMLIGSVLPRPIAFVSTLSRDGIANVAPYSFFTAVSSKPPYICFSPNRRGTDGSTKDTLNNILDQGDFVVNIVSEDIIEKVNNAATEFPPTISEFDAVGLTPVPSNLVSAPRVRESLIHFECRLHKVVEVGPKGPGGGAVVIGEVVLFHVADDLLKDGRIDIHKLKPVGRLAGLDYAKLGEIFSLQRMPYKSDDG